MGICKSKKQARSTSPQVTNNNNKIAKPIDAVKETSPNNIAAGSPMVLSQQDFFLRSQELLTPDKQSTVNKGKFFNSYTLLENLKSPYEQIRQVFTVQHNITGVTKVGIIQSHQYKQMDLSKLQSKIQQLKKLDHPNIMSIYEFFIDQKQLFIITDNYNGGTLFQRLKIDDVNNSVSKNQLIQTYFQQILAGLQYLHSNGINHKYLKPQNILFQSQQSQLIKLVDYSNTRVKQREDELLDINYLAPEIISKQQYSSASDIWACGVLLYEIWTRNYPFQGKNVNEKKDNIQKCKIIKDENWNKIPPDAQKLIHLMLKADPSTRISAAECLQNEYLKNIGIYTDKSFIDEILQRIQSYQSKSEFQKILLSIMINRFMDEKEKEKLTIAFEAIDDNKDGKITKNELKKFLASEKQKPYTEIIFNILDSNQNGFIELNEFLLASCDTEKLTNQENLELLFKYIDKNRNQQITLKELKCLFIDARLTDQEWEQIFYQGDLNQNGKLSFEEFVQLLQQNPN